MITHRRTANRQDPQWSRHKMLTLLTGAGLCAVVLVAGLVLAVTYAIQPAHRAAAPGVSGEQTPVSATSTMHPDVPARDAQDELAARPMPTVDEAASHPSPVSMNDPGTPIDLPSPTKIGPAQVPTGFGHTPAGAMAQLAAIDQSALQSGSLAAARAVIIGWALPDGPTTSSWSVIDALGVLFDSVGLSGAGSTQLALVLTPLMGQIKGAVGPDFVVPCIDFEMDLTLVQTARGAIADCQRMVWHRDASGDRWMIGAGAEPATPPSIWPDTDLAISVGYRDLRQQVR